MKQIFLPLIFCFLLAATVFPQTEEARLFDEFGYINCDQYLARMQHIIIEQGNNPSHKVYFFVYEGKEKKPVYIDKKFMSYKSVFPAYGLAKEKIKSMKKWLSLQKAPLENYFFVSGGFREEFGIEAWFVPPGAGSPKPSPT